MNTYSTMNPDDRMKLQAELNTAAEEARRTGLFMWTPNFWERRAMKRRLRRHRSERAQRTAS